jgi:hypothetical protein
MLPSIILTHIFIGLIVFILKCGQYGVGAQYMRNDRPFFSKKKLLFCMHIYFVVFEVLMLQFVKNS